MLAGLYTFWSTQIKTAKPVEYFTPTFVAFTLFGL